MTCDNQPIAEMLVPFVEGALVEAERLQVADHLRHCPSCRDEARRLREAILGVRGLFSAGYRPVASRHPAAEDLAAFTLEPADLPEKLRRDLGLHLLECEVCSDHSRLLREMHRDLEGRVAPGETPLLLPRALREEIEKACPTAAVPEPPAREAGLPVGEYLAFLLSRFNWRPVVATGLAAVVLTVGFLFATSGPRGDVAGRSQPAVAPSAAPAATVPAPASPGPQPPAEVFLSVGVGRAEEAARALDREKIPYENRDGRLYLAPTDLARARQVVEPAASDEMLADAAAPAPAAEARSEAEAQAGGRASEVKGEAARVDTSQDAPVPASQGLAQVAPVAPAPQAPRPAAPVAQTPEAPRPAAPVVRAPSAPRPAAPAPRPAAPATRVAAPVPPRPAPTRRAAATSAPAPGATPVHRPAVAPQPTAAPVRSIEDAPPPPRVVALADDGLKSVRDPQAFGGSGPAEGAAPTPALAAAAKTRQGSSPAEPAPADSRAASSAEVRSPGANRAPAAVALTPERSRPVASDGSPSSGGRAAALEPRARQLAQGHSVSVRDGAGGQVEVVVILGGNLSNQEKNALRRQLRAELGLRDSDTITLR